MEILLISGLAAIAAANAAWWWYRDRDQQAHIRLLRAERDHARHRADDWWTKAIRAEHALRTASDEATSLQERNRMLTDLIGGDPK
ncbi:hypothetical protein ACQEVF_25130 [Nonomuraea polychroma]|uniref:hypothetical protein n=1 Tax=Nonomuraea polychroma TaxID=46176 RepID=UPI003D94A4E5